MPIHSEGGSKEFIEFLKTAETLEEATSGATTELSGLVTRSGDNAFAITTGEGQTYELDPGAVQRFRAEQGSGLTMVVTIRIASDVLKAAVLRPLKPIIKDIFTDPIKDLISDGGGGTVLGKDLITDPQTDKQPLKDIQSDPGTDKPIPKDFITDPQVDKRPFKDIHKDPLQDPINTGFTDNGGKPFGDPGNIPDPAGPVISPAFQAAAATAEAMPFVMQTPHHAASHLVAQQLGATPAFGAQFKAAARDTLKEIAVGETVKEPAFDTRKEMIIDTRKEMVWDTWVEGGPFTNQEGTFDPGNQFPSGPLPEPWAGGFQRF